MTTTVRSVSHLTNDFVEYFTKLPVDRLAVTAPSALVETKKLKARQAIFAIHGMSPTQRYAFQDQVATSLESFLNANEQLKQSKLSWNSVVHWPLVAKNGDSRSVRPSAVRVFRSDDNPDDPHEEVFDVYEGYWSPFSKGKTNIISALKWLLNSTLLPASSTASVPCTIQKLRSDLGYIAYLLSLVILALILFLVFALEAWTRFLALALPSASELPFWELLRDPISLALSLPVPAYIELAAAAAAAYVLVQLYVMHRSSLHRGARTRELVTDAHTGGSRFRQETISATLFHRHAFIILWIMLALLVVVAIGVGVIDNHFNWNHAGAYVLYAVLVVAAAVVFQVARHYADFAVENVLGDLQIYTTHDENSVLYSIRQQIVQSVTDALTGVLRAVDDSGMEAKPYYDSVHIFGHSLGSTIGMDVLILLRQMVQEKLLTLEQWKRIRTFTTFGTALEKTRYFFNVRFPTISAAQSEWKDDVYGRFFTNDATVLEQFDNTNGIYWSNLWYIRDIVANEIVSYQSDVPAGGQSFVWTQSTREICQNYELPHVRPRFAWVHSDYLNDPLFWEKVAPIIA